MSDRRTDTTTANTALA